MVDFKEVSKTGAEFIGCAITPGYSSYTAVGEIHKHQDKLKEIENKLSIMGYDVLIKKEDLQMISKEMQKEKAEIWKKKCEVFWIPGMLVFTVMSFVSSIFSKEEDPSIFILKSIEQTDAEIAEKTKNIKSIMREYVSRVCVDKKTTYDAEIAKLFVEKVEIEKPVYDQEIKELIEDVLNLEEFVSTGNYAKIRSLRGYQKETVDQKEKIDGFLNDLKSLKERKNGLLNIKENYIDQEKKLISAEDDIKTKEQEIKKAELKINQFDKEISQYKKISEYQMSKIGENFYQVGLAKFAEKNGLDPKTLKNLEKHLKPLMEQALKEGRKELNIVERDIRNIFPDLWKSSQQKISLDTLSEGDFEKEVMNSEFLKGKNLNEIYGDYFHLLKTTYVSDIDSNEKFTEYVTQNTSAYFKSDKDVQTEKMNMPLIEETRDNFLKLDKLNKVISDYKSSLVSEKIKMESYKAKINAINDMKTEMSKELANLDSLKKENQKIIDSKVDLDKDLDKLEQSIKEKLGTVLDSPEFFQIEARVEISELWTKLTSKEILLSPEAGLAQRGELVNSIVRDFLQTKGIQSEAKDILRTESEAFQEKMTEYKNKVQDLNIRIEASRNQIVKLESEIEKELKAL